MGLSLMTITTLRRVDCRCFLSFVFLGVARRLELSPCNTTEVDPADEEGSPPDYAYAGYDYVDYYPILVERYPQYYY